MQIGLSDSALENNICGKTAYVAESDVHFAHLTVEETLDFAIQAGTKKSKSHMIEAISKVSQSLRLSQSTNTKVGNDLIPGCSGGEKKRLTIAEILLSDSSIQCWDNPTRGLDSENAAIFIKALRQQCNDSGYMAAVTLYQASEQIFEVFDKVLVLYEGRQIFFGPCSGARAYFYELGFAFTPRVSSGEFLASLTHPPERIIREGFTSQVPDTPQQFETIWHSSSEHGRILETIQLCGKRLPAATNHRPISRRIYRRSYAEQIHLCLVRCLQRLKQNWTPSLSAVIGNLVLSIILGSMFYDMQEETNSFYGRAALIFFVSMTNTCLGAFEGVQLWEHRSIIEKHKQYGFHRPSAEAIASMVASLPEKFLLSTAFNIPFYFLANMRRTQKAFFIFYLFGFVSLLTGSMLFRALGAVTRTVPSSIAPGSNLILLLLIYSGFVLPIPMMPPWLSWIRYINPVGYVFESLMINEFGSRKFKCSRFVQGTRRCAIMDTGFDSEFVDGTAYLEQTYDYQMSHLWRNLVWIVIIMMTLMLVYLIASEHISMAVLQPHGKIPNGKRKENSRARNRDAMEPDVEAQLTVPVERKSPYESHIEHGSGKLYARQRTTFLWRNISCEMKLPTKISGQSRESKMILSAVDGWVLPGTLTALMGASGAGKTTLLNVLAGRPAVGIVSGMRKTNTIYENEAFSSKVGYAQQQDLHLPTMTVREAFEFSALLRQPAKYSKKEKLELVDDIILDLDMGAFQHAVIGVLNVEQQKRVTIGIELAARPELLLFLDEPTSGMDTNTAWLICKLLRKLCTNGQAVLCTIHQPSARLFRMFDRLLLLQKGKTIYFGDIGHDAQKITSYFEKGGAKPCKITENPAEWMLKVVDDPGTSWSDFWTQSEERKVSQMHLDELEGNLNVLSHADVGSERSREFAASFSYQLRLVSVRNFVHDWRTPDYISSKLWLTIGAVSVPAHKY
jgi:ATP-binding cassette subfamily G (WHITE) protein 2 (PDR)